MSTLLHGVLHIRQITAVAIAGIIRCASLVAVQNAARMVLKSPLQCDPCLIPMAGLGEWRLLWLGAQTTSRTVRRLAPTPAGSRPCGALVWWPTAGFPFLQLPQEVANASQRCLVAIEAGLAAKAALTEQPVLGAQRFKPFECAATALYSMPGGPCKSSRQAIAVFPTVSGPVNARMLPHRGDAELSDESPWPNTPWLREVLDVALRHRGLLREALLWECEAAGRILGAALDTQVESCNEHEGER